MREADLGSADVSYDEGQDNHTLRILTSCNTSSGSLKLCNKFVDILDALLQVPVSS